jgi:hypothetical protein
MVPLTFLLPENLLDLYDLFLDFAGYLFGFAFRLQLGIISEFSGHFLDITLRFVNRAFPFALHAGFMVFLLSDAQAGEPAYAGKPFPVFAST